MAKRKGTRVQFRGTTLDSKRLAALARVWEVTNAEVLRRLIREAHIKVFHQLIPTKEGKP
jgi:hypothetical protein